jgi:hypothetical protein
MMASFLSNWKVGLQSVFFNSVILNSRNELQSCSFIGILLIKGLGIRILLNRFKSLNLNRLILLSCEDEV